jgi:hypothetical protein
MGKDVAGIVAAYKGRMKEDSDANARRICRNSSHLKGDNERRLRCKWEKKIPE